MKTFYSEPKNKEDKTGLVNYFVVTHMTPGLYRYQNFNETTSIS